MKKLHQVEEKDIEVQSRQHKENGRASPPYLILE